MTLLRYAQRMRVIEKARLHPPLTVPVTANLCDQHSRVPRNSTSLYTVVIRDQSPDLFLRQRDFHSVDRLLVRALI